MAFAIRTATADDVPELHALVESAYRGASARAGWTHEADLLDGQRTDVAMLAKALCAPDRVILAAVDALALIGCCEVVRVASDGAYLGLLSVAPPRQGAGLATALIIAAEREAQSRFAARRIEMTVIRQRGELIAYYARRGYLPTGEARPFPYGDTRFGEPRRDDLEFVVLEKRFNRSAV